MTRSDPDLHDWRKEPQFASTGPSDGLDFMSSGRGAEEFLRAHRHSRRVRFLKLGLPLGAAFVIVAIASVTLFSGSRLPDLEVGDTTVRDGKLVMSNPRLDGTDQQNRPYNLTADKAEQDATKLSRISLESIVGKLPISDDGFAAIRAGTGIYDADSKTLELGGNVSVDTDDGMSLRLEDAHIDIGTGTINSSRPVEVSTGNARIKAQSLSVADKGKTIVFTGSVHMTIQPQAGDGAAAPSGAALRGTQPVSGEDSAGQ
ncbi:MAG: LPS export ABC transporter periplasmic protein LptC [Nitratireductor sp.]|nr:LPS export ABC transporter periplasmic protein LptC [Nitratireductor sp.]